MQLDILLMLLRQESRSETSWVFLSSDASAIRGKDYFMTLEDTVTRSHAAEIIDADTDKLESWDHLTTRILPLALVGYGNANAASKAEALFHSIKLDVGTRPEQLGNYSDSLVSFCSDFGTESQLAEIPPMDVDELLSSVWRKSDLLSAPFQCEPDLEENAPPSVCEAHWFNLQASLFIPGMKHILDNLTGDLLSALEHFEHFQDGASCPGFIFNIFLLFCFTALSLSSSVFPSVCGTVSLRGPSFFCWCMCPKNHILHCFLARHMDPLVPSTFGYVDDD